jgi:hypothetical protein
MAANEFWCSFPGIGRRQIMIERELMFIVDGFVHDEHFTVLGHCGDAPIHVGEIFDAVYRNKASISS